MGSSQPSRLRYIFIPTLLIFVQVCIAIYPAYEQSYDEQYSQDLYSYKEEEYPIHGRKVLDSKGRYILEWTVKYQKKMIEFDITCNTTGWVGLGMSKNGEMKGADIMIGGVRLNGQPYLSDMYADYYRRLYSDTKPDWILVSAKEDYGVTYLRVARPLDSCDVYDYPITMDLLSVIWAFGDTDDIGYHFEKRGSFRVYLLDPVIKTYESPLEKWELRTKVVMSTNPTSYICTIRRAPVLTEKHHIVEVHPYLENEIAVTHTHHFLLWRCVAPPNDNAGVIFEPFTTHPGEECYFTQVHVLPHLLCKFLITGWAIGGKPFILPYSVGIPLGESPAEYYMLETHYNNPLGYSGIKITTGLDIYYTDKLRPNDGGTMFLPSHDIFGLFMVPPVTTEFEVYAYCTPKCTKTMFPDSGVEIIAVQLHAHISGKKMKLQHFRKGYELKVIIEDGNYDPTFQQVRVLYEPRLVLPGDQLVITCVYDTTWNNITTVSGFSTREEMCVAGVLINKRVPYFACVSQVPQETLLPVIGVEKVEWDIESQQRVITEPASLAGKPLSYVTDRLIAWEESLRYRIQDVTLRSTQIGMCPKVLAPSSVQDTQSNDGNGVVGTVISSTANTAEMTTLAKGYGVEVLMGTLILPTRTPGPISLAKYPFSGARYTGRTCPRLTSPFVSYYTGS